MLENVREASRKIIVLMDKIIQGNEETLAAYQHNDPERYEAARILLRSCDLDADLVDEEIVNAFVNQRPDGHEMQLLVTFLKINNELMRIGVGTGKYARRIEQHRNALPELHRHDNVIMHLHQSSINALRHIRDCFAQLNACDVEEIYRKVMVEESKNDDLYAVLEKEIMANVITGTDDSMEYVKVLGTLRRLERIGDRALNMADLMIKASENGA